jgi:bifunctional polynucleotide phosphatase/kinase
MMKSKICFLDLDGTLIKTASGKQFPKDTNDWEFIKETAKFIKLKKLKGFKIILVTNQAGISRGYVDHDEFKKKLIAIQEDLNLYFDKTFVATSLNSRYRKPKSKQLELDLKKEGIVIDKDNSMMIGDAGGGKRDFSDSDLEFAKSLNIDFIHSDEIKDYLR